MEINNLTFCFEPSCPLFISNTRITVAQACAREPYIVTTTGWLGLTREEDGWSTLWEMTAYLEDVLAMRTTYVCWPSISQPRSDNQQHLVYRSDELDQLHGGSEKKFTFKTEEDGVNNSEILKRWNNNFTIVEFWINNNFM